MLLFVDSFVALAFIKSSFPISFSVRLQPQLANSAQLQLEAVMSTTVFQNFLLGVPIIEQQIGGHISTVTGQNSAKL